VFFQNRVPATTGEIHAFGHRRRSGPLCLVLAGVGIALAGFCSKASAQENGADSAGTGPRITRLPSLADQILIPAKIQPESATLPAVNPIAATTPAGLVTSVGNPHVPLANPLLPDEPASEKPPASTGLQSPLLNSPVPISAGVTDSTRDPPITSVDDNHWQQVPMPPSLERVAGFNQIPELELFRLPEIENGFQKPVAPAQTGTDNNSRFTAAPAGNAELWRPAPTIQNDEPWWRSKVAEPLTGQTAGQPLDVCTLVQEAMQSSKQIQALSQTPLIRESEIGVALAEFDPGLFAQSLYDDRVDPVGNTLTTGGLPFLKDNIWSGEAGFRQKLYTGGNLKISQALGFQNSNSRFFVPQDQGTATLSINFQQPLLRGRGEFVNRSQIYLAEVATGAAGDEFAARLQDELNLIVTAYWVLYSNRAQLLQRQKNYDLGRAVLEKLEGRKNFDTLPLQLAQARSAVASRETALANAQRDVLIAETEIRRLISAADWTGWHNVELLTVEPPLRDPSKMTMEASVHTALENRPELRQATMRTKAAAIRNQVSANELLPDLKLLFSTYVAALEPESGVLPAWSSQFNGSTPGFAAGLQFDFPWRNRAARSKYKQSELELTRAQLELEQVTVNLIVDAQQAWYRLESARQRLDSSLIAMSASKNELEQLEVRWTNAALIEGDWSDGQTQSLILDQLLAAQQKQFDAERVVVESEQELKLSQVNLKRATGTLLGYCQGVPGQISIEETGPSGENPIAPGIPQETVPSFLPQRGTK